MRGLERMLHHWGALLHRRPWVAGGLVRGRARPAGLAGHCAAHRHAEHRDHPAEPERPGRLHRGGRTPSARARPARCRSLTPSADRPAGRRPCSRGQAASPPRCPPGEPRAGAMTLAIPTTDARRKATGATIDRLRRELPKGSLVGGAAAENHDLEKALSGPHAAGLRPAHRAGLPAAARRPRLARWSRSSAW